MGSPAQEALDRLEIHELRGKYSRAIDYENYSDASDVFTEDAVLAYPDTELHGSDEIAEFWREEVEYQFSRHTVQMPSIQIDGDTATGDWYMLVFYVALDGTDGAVMGWYSDEYERVDGNWKIARMEAGVTYDTGGHHT
jgi:ketosteroid isomerase-like protein